MTPKQFGAQIRMRRLEQHLTTRELAEILWISNAGGNPFTLLSLDSSQAFTLDPDPGSLELTAFFVGGGSTTQSFGITLNVWETFAPTGFANLSRVEIHAPGTDLALDNIHLVAGSASVPEPSALAVFALGIFAGIFGSRSLSQRRG